MCFCAHSWRIMGLLENQVFDTTIRFLYKVMQQSTTIAIHNDGLGRSTADVIDQQEYSIVYTRRHLPGLLDRKTESFIYLIARCLVLDAQDSNNRLHSGGSLASQVTWPGRFSPDIKLLEKDHYCASYYIIFSHS